MPFQSFVAKTNVSVLAVGRFLDDIRRLGFTGPTGSTLKDPSPLPFSYNEALACLINYAYSVKDAVPNSNGKAVKSIYETIISRLQLDEKLKPDFIATIGEIYVNPVLCGQFTNFNNVRLLPTGVITEKQD
jgi:hypothetical protein